LSGYENDKRLNEILDMIGRVAALDFSTMLQTSDKNDMIDAIALGLNMLSEELNANVVERSKLDDVNCKLEKFAYTAAHDLKSPLNSINGLVTLLEHSISTGQLKDVEHCIALLKTTTEKMKSLVQGILDYSKADATHIDTTEVDLNAVLKEVIETDQLTTRADIKIVGTLPCATFNRPAMEQIIRNLLNNAIKYSDKELCQIVVRARDRGEQYQISVTDNGPGIPTENHERIFDLFHKSGSGPRSDSQGIGLATVKSILDAFGEKIWVESEVGKGATFCFTLRKRK